MVNCIIAVVILGENSLVTWFDDGVSKRYTAKDLGIDNADDFASAHISADSTMLVWNNAEGISAQDLYELGEVVNYVENEKHHLLKTLSEIRREASFSQTRLGEAAGIRQSVISRIEGCEISPQINTLLKLLAPLGKTLAIVDLKDSE
ncbi:MAG: helix-turn-helix domain-containing protein [Coriobacteriales bacterium]|nr:helix-turn-helix domain-containing protein [Coriobacteriales bacterium]